MELTETLDFIRPRRQGVLATIRANGRPQLSNILFWLDDGGVVRISITDDRAKTANLRRDPRASLYVVGDSFWAYAVLECTAELSAVAAAPDDATVEELVTMYRALQGEHDDWDDYRRAMVDQRRIVAHLRPERAYGMVPS
jgi:PPOX class probable F420-dependent enzyme